MTAAASPTGKIQRPLECRDKNGITLMPDTYTHSLEDVSYAPGTHASDEVLLVLEASATARSPLGKYAYFSKA
jgi:hypothetical protein